jgi:YesN/AraC family two-component response regulator
MNQNKMKAHPEKIMIIEDDILLLLVEERLIKRLGYEVIGTASEGTLALEKIKNLQPDILLIDINIKGNKNGLDIVEHLNKEGIEIPVIFLSGESDRQLINKARELGCVDYLMKPVTTTQLEVSLSLATKQLKAQCAA